MAASTSRFRRSVGSNTDPIFSPLFSSRPCPSN
uniref:Uncharacterized protein n=1 Tax=Arundo donax TaxID=35708 RepID=A0A0A9HL99_ARUDO